MAYFYCRRYLLSEQLITVPLLWFPAPSLSHLSRERDRSLEREQQYLSLFLARVCRGQSIRIRPVT
jgi:hypothetical protein